VNGGVFSPLTSCNQIASLIFVSDGDDSLMRFHCKDANKARLRLALPLVEMTVAKGRSNKFAVADSRAKVVVVLFVDLVSSSHSVLLRLWWS
jgi:hypothetical protein